MTVDGADLDYSTYRMRRLAYTNEIPRRASSRSITAANVSLEEALSRVTQPICVGFTNREIGDFA